MKLLGDRSIGVLFCGLLVMSIPHARAATASAADGPPRLLTELKFGSPSTMAQTTSAVSSTMSAPGWNYWLQTGGSLGVQATASPAGNGTVNALEGSYPVPSAGGGSYVGAGYNVSALNTEDVYIEFWAKMPGVKEGCKFVKIFGDRSSAAGYADTTIATDYTGADYGAIRQISFGSGGNLINDSQDVIDLTGLHSYLGRSAGTASINTPQQRAFSSTDWGSGWHHFRIHVRFNSGTTSQNEVPNGEYYLEIDGKVYVDATGLYNRNPVNGPINHIAFFGWAQTEPKPFQVWYYDIRISTGGFMSSPLPDPPTNIGAK